MFSNYLAWLFVVLAFVLLFRDKIKPEAFYALLILGVVFAAIGKHDVESKKQPQGIFTIGNPIVEEIRYEILGGNDTPSVFGSASGHFFHGYGSVSGSISEDSFYKIYYPGTNADGEKIAIPKIVKEIETEVVICPDDMQSEYLLEIVTTQQYMERKYQKEQYFEDVSRRYKLYVRESTFNNKVVLDGN